MFNEVMLKCSAAIRICTSLEKVERASIAK